jgi:hypothetical protein
VQLDTCILKYIWTRQQLAQCRQSHEHKLENVVLRDGDLVAGLDISTSSVDADFACAALVLLEYPTLKVNRIFAINFKKIIFFVDCRPTNKARPPHTSVHSKFVGVS